MVARQSQPEGQAALPPHCCVQNVLPWPLSAQRPLPHSPPLWQAAPRPPLEPPGVGLEGVDGLEGVPGEAASPHPETCGA